MLLCAACASAPDPAPPPAEVRLVERPVPPACTARVDWTRLAERLGALTGRPGMADAALEIYDAALVAADRDLAACAEGLAR